MTITVARFENIGVWRSFHHSGSGVQAVSSSSGGGVSSGGTLGSSSSTVSTVLSSRLGSSSSSDVSSPVGGVSVSPVSGRDASLSRTPIFMKAIPPTAIAMIKTMMMLRIEEAIIIN
mgnify:CR=1 FL=1